MFFDTPIYIVFLTGVVLAYWRLRWRQQNVLLLVASYVFYGWWDPRFLALIATSTIVDFYCARTIARSDRVVLFHIDDSAEKLRDRLLRMLRR